MNREEELDESIIQPTPGNSFTAGILLKKCYNLC